MVTFSVLNIRGILTFRNFSRRVGLRRRKTSSLANPKTAKRFVRKSEHIINNDNKAAEKDLKATPQTKRFVGRLYNGIKK